MSSVGETEETSVRALLANRRYTLYLVSRLSLIIGAQMLSIAAGWQIYELTGQALALGLSGLVLFLPAVFLALPGGHLADALDRRRILMTCHVGFTTAATILAVVTYRGAVTTGAIYTLLVVFGVIRAFSAPASQALMPNLVDKQDLQRAVAFGSSAWQLAMIAGPALGGAVYAATGKASVVYGVCAAFGLIAFVSIVAVGHDPTNNAPRRTGPVSWDTVLAGIRYIWSDKPILGAISLDLFAVLLGGAVALLPIYARDLLHVGPSGLGLLRSAPAGGAAVAALGLARSPLRKRAGFAMLTGVFLFGLATIVFGVSRSFYVSLAALFFLGAFDMFSVVVRSTLIQLRTPDEMRGRVSAVNMVFISASNELGEFESGVTAAWLGPELAVLVGGVGTCLVVVAWAVMFPQLRKIDKLSG